MSQIVEGYVRELHFILDAGNIESDQFNNALSVKMTIEKLHENDQISLFDAQVLSGVANGFSFSEIALILVADRKRVSNSFKQTCSKIAYKLGDEFTDTGFMYRIAARHAVGAKRENELKEFFD
ncbi:hypothetical protein LCGC14_0593030 [marine sediment metagenome]|uniref:Uncharacterized protein n=1 Tax=marine sediment metagenome TaxID=412755 RepID=A0A0F9RCS2_9ZZZZ